MISFLDAWLPLFTGTSVVFWYKLGSEFGLTGSLLRLLALEIASLALWVVYWAEVYPTYLSPFRHLPTPPKRSWLLGNRTVFLPDYPLQDVRNAVETVKNDGLIRYYETLSREVLVATTPEALRDMLSLKPYDFGHPGFVKYLMARLTGSKFNFLTPHGHRHFRKHLRSAFTPAHTKRLVPALWEKSEEMVHLIEDEVRENPDRVVNLRDYGRRIMWDSFGLTVLGHDFETLRKPDSDIRNRFTQMQPETRAFDWGWLVMSFVDLRPLLRLLSPILKRSTLKRASNYIRDFAGRLVEGRQEHIRARGFSEVQDLDILSIAVASGAFPKDELIDHLMLFFTAGPNSTSVALDWALYELGGRPEMQQKLREEIRGRLKTTASSATIEVGSHIQSLPYLNAIVSEVIRLYPFIPLSSKVAQQDTSILGEPVPRGTVVLVPVEAFNRDKKLWGEDADKFDPDRWLEDASGGASTNYAMMTFGAGPMACIGQNFARAMLASFVAALVLRFDIEIVNLETAARSKPGQFKISAEGMRARLKVVDSIQTRK